MCFSFDREFYRDYSWGGLLNKPLSAHLLWKTLEFRNGTSLPHGLRPASCHQVAEAYAQVGCFEGVIRKVVSEPLFLVVAVACVVECVARMIIYALAAIPLLLSEYCLQGAFDACLLAGGGTLFFLFQGLAACTVGFVISPWVCNWIDITDLNLR